MSFDLAALMSATAEHGTVARVVIARVDGSSPREVGASMLVWDGGQSGTIGGGKLEFDTARDALKQPYVKRIPLGPALGQCCGGAVTLVCEHFEAKDLSDISDIALRRVDGHLAGDDDDLVGTDPIIEAIGESKNASDPNVGTLNA